MERKPVLLMNETSVEQCRSCKTTLEEEGINVVMCLKEGYSVYEELVRLQPDAALLDAYLPGMNAIAVKKKFAEHCPEAKTVFFMVGPYQKEAQDCGFAEFFQKPFDVNVLASRIKQALNQKTTTQPMLAIEAKVTDMQRAVGMPAHLKGYQYTRGAIIMVVEEPELINSITKKLYPAVAEKNKTTATCVERSIRNAIERAWERGDAEMQAYYFGGADRSKPTNSEFIATLAQRITLDLKRQA